MRSGMLVLALVLAARTARAEDPRIASARASYFNGDHDRTIAVVTALLPTLRELERARALRLLGCAHMVLGDRVAATKAFRESFALEADAALDPDLASSPDARGLFEVARGEWHNELIIAMQSHAEDIKRLAIAVDAPARARGGRAIPIAVRIDDPARLGARVELSYRRRGQALFTLMTQHLERGAAASFTVPADATETSNAFALDYHITVRHQSGFDLRRVGDPDHLRTIEVAPGHRPRWHESWWARGAVALGVVGLAAGGYLFYRSIDVGGQHVLVDARR